MSRPENKGLVSKNKLTAIADAIRTKSETTDSLNLDEMVTAIDELSQGKEEQEKSITITSNGTAEVLSDEGKVLSKVNITANVDGPAKGLIFGDYDSDGYPHSATFVGRWYNIPNNYCKDMFVKAVDVTGTDLSSFGRYVTKLVLPPLKKGGTCSYSNICCNASSLTELIIPSENNEVEFIGVYGSRFSSFLSQSGVETITLPETIKNFDGEATFAYNKKLQTVNIPSQVTSLPSGCFASCGFTTFNVPDNVTALGQFDNYISTTGVFQYCENLTSVTLPNTLQYTGYGAFRGCDKLSDVNISNSMTVIQPYTFCGCKALKSITIPDNIVALQGYCFAESGIETIIIPNTVTTLTGYNRGAAMFQRCKSLTSITFSANAPVIPEYCCTSCDVLAEVIIPEGVEEIRERAFYNNPSLINITLPASMKTIGSTVFWLGDVSASSEYTSYTVRLKGTVPPTIQTTTFYSKAQINKIYVPSSAVETYKTATNWAAFADYIEANPDE